MTAKEAIQQVITLIESAKLNKTKHYNTNIQRWITDCGNVEEAIAYTYGDQLIDELKKMMEELDNEE